MDSSDWVVADLVEGPKARESGVVPAPRGQVRVAELPGGEVCNKVINETSEEERDLAVHGRPLRRPHDDKAGAGRSAAASRCSRRSRSAAAPAPVRGKLHETGDGGFTEFVYQPCCPDSRRELEKFLEIAKS